MQGDFYQSNIKSKLYLVAEYWFLNLLCLVISLPVITIPPALFALYHVTYKWVKEEGGGLFKEFFSGFKQYLLRSYLYSFILITVLCSLYLYVQLGINSQLINSFTYILISLAMIISLLMLLIHQYFITFSVMMDAPVRHIFLMSFTFAIRKIHITIFLIISKILLIMILIAFPYLLIFSIFPVYVFFKNKFLLSFVRNALKKY